MSAQELPDDHSECEPPDPISNSEVKVLSADGSVGSPHVRVGHCQALNPKPLSSDLLGGFFMPGEKLNAYLRYTSSLYFALNLSARCHVAF